MTTATIVYGVAFVVGVFNIGIGVSQWRAGGKTSVLAGAMFVAMAVSGLTVGWVRYVAWAAMALVGAIEGRSYFTERDPVKLYIGLVFLPLILAIALIEVFIDHLTLMQTAVFLAIAALAAAAIVTAIARLIQARSARHA